MATMNVTMTSLPPGPIKAQKAVASAINTMPVEPSAFYQVTATSIG
jgi:hypothetical protein